MSPSTDVLCFSPEQAPPRSAPPLPRPRRYRPKIGLIGCGNIATTHLEAYRADDWDVVALCDARAEAALRQSAAFYPESRIHTDYRSMLDDPTIDVIDVALHPEHRVEVIGDALRAGKHVLSQKPFALDLATAKRLVAQAESEGVHLAVNQNARWAPYLHYLRALCEHGHLGTLQSAIVHINWDHTWIRGMDFEKIHHIVLFDFAIHWIDFIRLCFGPQAARSVFASARPALQSTVKPPLAAVSTITFGNGVASLLFDGNAAPGAGESITLIGDKGTARASGPLHAADSIEVTTAFGQTRPVLAGRWYREGFRGAMGELLCAIEEERPPTNSAADNLRTLKLLFALVDSADSGEARRPGEVACVGPTCRIVGQPAPEESGPSTGLAVDQEGNSA